MVALIVVALMIAVVLLWRRVDALERRLDERQWTPAPADPLAVAASPIPLDRAEEAPLAAPPAEIVAEVESGQATERPQRVWRPAFDFEDLFGRLLPIWAGGVTLAVAGFFLVRWSIDRGLLTPGVRVLLAGLFGAGLIAGAEVAYRWRERVADPRVAQALAGAGLATLYAAFYLAGSAYGLIGSTLAFMGLAAVTAAAIGLSFRFGLPSAVLGLVGGFAAPALVGSDEANLPLLTLYLALVTAGLAFTGRRQDRAWLGVGALGGGLGWGALLLANGIDRTPDAAVLGAYLVLLGAVIPALAGDTGRPHRFVRIGAAALGALQLAALVQQGGFGGLEWGLYLLLGAALAWFGWREPAMREANAVAAAVGVSLLLFWPEPDPISFAGVATAFAAIFGAVPLAQIVRGNGRALDIAQTSGVALGLGLAALAQFGTLLPEEPPQVLALALGTLALLPAAAAWFGRGREDASPGYRQSLLGAEAASALLVFAALAQVLPEDALAWAAAAVAAILAWRAKGLLGAIGTFAVLASLWAIEPLAQWLGAGALALGGEPMAAADLPGLRDMVLRLFPAIVAGAAWTMSTQAARRTITVTAIALGAVTVHIAFRHLFAMIAGTDFVATGIMQRAVWEALLLCAAVAARRWNWSRLSLGLALAALAHFGWFALVLHNPLWSEQAVGPVPVANALLALYGVGIAILLLVRQWCPAEPAYFRRATDGALMTVIALLALSLLRQAFAGSLLTSIAVGQVEDLLRSLTGILVAGGFLWWGARTGSRTWRIGSLVVMVIAVLKVFLVDAAGLEGLARIASFMALGFSLIGIGWFYNRQLRSPITEPLTS